MAKQNRQIFVSIFVVGCLLLAAIVATPWVSSQQEGTIPLGLQPGQVVVVQPSDSGGVRVGITVKEADDPNVPPELTVVLGNLPAQTPSTATGVVWEAVDAYLAEELEEDRFFKLSPTQLSNWSATLLQRLLDQEYLFAEFAEHGNDVGSSSFSTYAEVLCLTNDGLWTSETIRDRITITPLGIGETVLDYQVDVWISSSQKGACATFIDRDNFANVNVQRRAEAGLNDRMPAQGGVETYYNDPTR